MAEAREQARNPTGVDLTGRTLDTIFPPAEGRERGLPDDHECPYMGVRSCCSTDWCERCVCPPDRMDDEPASGREQTPPTPPEGIETAEQMQEWLNSLSPEERIAAADWVFRDPDEGREQAHTLVTPTSPSWRTTWACTCGERFPDKGSHAAHARRAMARKQ